MDVPSKRFVLVVLMNSFGHVLLNLFSKIGRSTPSMEQKLSEAGSLAVQFPNSADFEVRRLHQFGSDWFTITIWHTRFSEAFVVACIGIS